MPIHRFEVIVRGRLSPALLTTFGDFEAAHVDGGRTRLVGHGADQDALYRLFRVLQDLNIELVSVNALGEAPIGPPGPSASGVPPTCSEPTITPNT